MRFVELEYRSPIWFKPSVHVKYIVFVERVRLCQNLYGYGSSNFWACIDNDPRTKKIRIG